MKKPINLSVSRAERDARTLTLFTELLDRCLEAERQHEPERLQRHRTTLIESFGETLARATDMANKLTELGNLMPPAPLWLRSIRPLASHCRPSTPA